MASCSSIARSTLTSTPLKRTSTGRWTPLNEGHEDAMLEDWFKLIQEKHLLVWQESELILVFK